MTSRRVFLGAALGAVCATRVAGMAHAQSQARSGRIKTKDSVEIFVNDTGGSGRAVVLTHAWPLSADIWDHQAAALSKAGHRVITYDRRGFGRSSQPAMPGETVIVPLLFDETGAARLQIESSGGFVPAVADSNSQDRRFLGVYVKVR